MTRHDPPRGRADGQAPTTIPVDSDSDLLDLLAERLRAQAPPKRRWANIEATAEHFDTTVEHLRAMRKRGEIPAHRLGRLVRFDLDEVDQWLSNR